METTQLALRREAQRARFRHASWIALVAGVTGNGLLVLAMWAAAPRPVPAAVSVMPAAAPPPAPVVISSPVAPPVIVVVPAAAGSATQAQAFGDLGPCPAPYAARPSGALRQPSDQEMTHVAGAPTDSRWIAAWNEHDIHVSRDGGASWDRVLVGPGDVVDVSFDCHGRVLALRDGNGLGMRDGAREAWRTIPGVDVNIGSIDESRYTGTVVGGGRAVAVIGPRDAESGDGEAWVAISDDGGATWRHASLGWYDGSTSAAWHGDTLRIVAPWTDCMSEGIRLITVTAAGAKSQELDEWMSMVALDRGAVYGLTEYCNARIDNGDDDPPALCLWRQGRDWTALDTAPAESHGEEGVVTTLIDGPVDVVVRNDVAQTITGSRLGRARAWPVGAVPMATDLSGRLWGRADDGWLIRR